MIDQSLVAKGWDQLKTGLWFLKAVKMQLSKDSELSFLN